MFNRCRAWRRLLSRQAEGILTPSERALLDAHLIRCASCRKAEEADALLRCVYSSAEQPLTARSARSFDDRVLQSLSKASEPGFAVKFWKRLENLPTVSYEFCGQLAGGAFMAASITAFFIVSALHPSAAPRAGAVSERAALSSLEVNAPPIPLESLFQTRSPRAAMLWATPSESLRRAAPSPLKLDIQRPLPNYVPRQEPKHSHDSSPQPHSEQLHSIIAG